MHTATVDKSHARAVTIITADGTPLRDYVREIVVCYELLIALAVRDIRARYKQAALGVTWALIQPLATMLIFTVIFGKLAKIPSNDHPYSVFVYSGIILWTLFASGAMNASMSLVTAQGLLTKVYFPRVMLPLSTIACVLFDFAISLVLLLIMLLYHGYPLTVKFWLLIPCALGVATLAAAMGLLVCMYIVRFRDLRYVVPFVLQFWMYATPVIYPLDLVPEKYKFLMYLNPVSGYVDLFRSICFNDSVNLGLLATSVGGTVLLAAIAVWGFHNRERQISDYI